MVSILTYVMCFLNLIDLKCFLDVMYIFCYLKINVFICTISILLKLSCGLENPYLKYAISSEQCTKYYVPICIIFLGMYHEGTFK